MGTCAYIDILGFSVFVKEDPEGAIRLLQNYQVQLTLESNLQPNDPYLDPYRLNSFKYLIPFSDSIFFYSELPSEFVMQLSTFIHGSFSFTSNAFAHPEDPKYPEKVTEKGTVVEDGKLGVKDYPANWYPLLFRGGIGHGDAQVLHLNAIHDGTAVKTPFVFGNSVVEAVRMDSVEVNADKIKGPRILCTRAFFDVLSPRAKRIVHPTFDKSELYEINWTAVHYLMYDELTEFFVDQILINDFSNIFRPAANLWSAYRENPKIEPHYKNFLKLIVCGLKHFFLGSEYEQRAFEYVSRSFVELGLSEIREYLVG